MWLLFGLIVLYSFGSFNIIVYYLIVLYYRIFYDRILWILYFSIYYYLLLVIIIPRDNLLDYTIIVSWSFIFYELIIDSLLSYIKIRLNNIMYFIMIV